MSLDNERYDRHFLIVDDQKLMQTMLREMMRAGGYKKIACANSGREALAAIKKYPVDFIIADWNMPNMSGIELLAVIKENPAYIDIPFLMVTGENSKDKIAYAVEEGVDGYLIKPLSQEKIINTVRKVLDEKSNPNTLNNKVRKITRLIIQKKYDEALTLGKQILGEEERPEILLLIGECYLHKKDYEKAKKYVQKALEFNNRDSKALCLIGKICMAEEKYEEAIKYLRQSSEMNPLNLNRKIEIGNVYLKLGLVNEAAEEFGSMKESEITDLNKVQIGAAYLSHGDVKKAGEYLEKTVDPVPETISVFNNYAMELRKLGEYDECIRQYEKCLKIERGNYFIFYNLGRVYFELEKYEESQKALEDSLKSNNTKPAQKLLDYVKSIRARKYNRRVKKPSKPTFKEAGGHKQKDRSYAIESIDD